MAAPGPGVSMVGARAGAGAGAGARAPRKAAATQRLGGKALRKKQKAGLYFFMHAGVGHDGWLTGKSEYHFTQT